jgi:hypothetical protein
VIVVGRGGIISIDLIIGHFLRIRTLWMESRPNPMVASLPILPRHVPPGKTPAKTGAVSTKTPGIFLYVDQNGRSGDF